MKNGNCYAAKVLEAADIYPGAEIFNFHLWASGLKKDSVHAGQFFSFRPENGALMPRPFSVAWADGNDSGYYLDFFIRAVGEQNSNTRLYSKLKSGEEIEIFGSYGKEFELIPEIKKYLFVGGGMGMSGIFTLARKAKENGKGVEIIFGVKKEGGIFGRNIFERLGIQPKIIVEEKSSFHDQGSATDLLKNILDMERPKTAVVACGPRLMLKAVYELAHAHNVPCLVSVENVMACGGAGLCQGCAIEMTDGSFEKVCEDGPIFDAARINWEEGKFIPLPAVKIKSSMVQTENPLKITLGGKEKRVLNLEYPWGIAPGCGSLEDALNRPDLKVGFHHTKAVMLKARKGNPPPRVCEAGNGSMLNSIGLPGEGVDEFIEKKLPLYLGLNRPTFIQIAGETVREYLEVAEKFAGLPVLAIDINVSCPNIERGGTIFGADPENVYKIVRGVRLILPYVLLSVKLTPNVADIISPASAAVDGGADILALINTLKGMRIDLKTRRKKLGRGFGGYSGRRILPVGIWAVNEIYRAKLGVPIKGMGGISCGEDVLEYMLAGATLIEVGTEYFSNRNIFDEITAAVLGYLKKEKANHVLELNGIAE
jgi:dihydroorotate dehydrogenase (NAD+) catalytic subunit